MPLSATAMRTATRWSSSPTTGTSKSPTIRATGFGHLAVSVPDIYATCEQLEKAGVPVPRPPGPMKHGTTVIAFIEDPDGYKIELVAAR